MDRIVQRFLGGDTDSRNKDDKIPLRAVIQVGSVDPSTGKEITKKDVIDYWTIHNQQAERNKQNARDYIDLLSQIVTDEDFEYFLDALSGFMSENTPVEVNIGMAQTYYNPKDLAISVASSALRGIMNRVDIAFKKKGIQTTEQRLDLILEKKLQEKQRGGNDNG